MVDIVHNMIKIKIVQLKISHFLLPPKGGNLMVEIPWTITLASLRVVVRAMTLEFKWCPHMDSLKQLWWSHAIKFGFRWARAMILCHMSLFFCSLKKKKKKLVIFYYSCRWLNKVFWLYFAKSMSLENCNEDSQFSNQYP